MSRIRDLVTDPVSRTYLKHDGWWAEEVVEQFAFLEDQGFSGPAIHLHQYGHFVQYGGPDYDVCLSYEPWNQADPENQAEASLFYRDKEQFRPLDDAAQEADPSYVPPTVSASNAVEIKFALGVWAAAMRRLLRVQG